MAEAAECCCGELDSHWAFHRNQSDSHFLNNRNSGFNNLWNCEDELIHFLIYSHAVILHSQRFLVLKHLLLSFHLVILLKI